VQLAWIVNTNSNVKYLPFLFFTSQVALPSGEMEDKGIMKNDCQISVLPEVYLNLANLGMFSGGGEANT
jgi:hypothetical protein